MNTYVTTTVNAMLIEKYTSSQKLIAEINMHIYVICDMCKDSKRNNICLALTEMT